MCEAEEEFFLLFLHAQGPPQHPNQDIGQVVKAENT